jgi:undecaprenyl-diphosphatase
MVPADRSQCGTNRLLAGYPAMAKRTEAKAAKPLLKLDKQAKDLFAPYRGTLPVRAIDTFGEAGDQLQMRILCGGVFALGLVRADGRMMRAAARMLLAHEVATFANGVVKRRVDRLRPRSTSGRNPSKPHKGRSSAKEKQSFPSGHSAGATAVACAFAAEYPEYRVPALAAAGAVALAQIPTSAHYPSDVAAGATIGAATDTGLGLVWRAAAEIWRRRHRLNHLLAKWATA